MKPIAALGLVFLLAACGPAASPSPTNHDISGTLALRGSDAYSLSVPQDGAECHGKGGYDDIVAGAQVTVKDQSGAIIGTGKLGDGVWKVSYSGCRFGFTVNNVPDVTFYSIELSHRGALTYSAAEMAGKGWKVDFTLGG